MTKNALANIFTFGNLSFGLLSLIMTFEGNYKLACFLILAAGIVDRYDGRIARYFNVSSDMGKELDSLADLISFGLAPIIVAWKISFMTFGLPGYAVSLIYPIAGAYRLARYNVTTFDDYYRGIPITIAGAFLSLDSLYNCFILLKNGKLSDLHVLITAILIVLLSYLMVSKIKIKKM
jgi:CDP-diacylglycerol--serine O-phosphatidyltransferase